MQCSCKKNTNLKEEKINKHSFSIEERKWAAEAVADCYKRIENGTAKLLKLKSSFNNISNYCK